jgi:hypothetical protein
MSQWSEIQSLTPRISQPTEGDNEEMDDARSHLALAETAMAERLNRTGSDLRVTGKTMFGP